MSNPKSKAKAETSSQTCSTSRPKPDGYDALPKRFKDYINALDAELTALKRVLDSEGVTRVSLETYSRLGAARYLPDDARVIFALEATGARRRRIEVQVDRRRGSNGLSISSPDGRVIVLPEVSNEICVRVGDV